MVRNILRWLNYLMLGKVQNALSLDAGWGKVLYLNMEFVHYISDEYSISTIQQWRVTLIQFTILNSADTFSLL